MAATKQHTAAKPRAKAAAKGKKPTLAKALQQRVDRIEHALTGGLGIDLAQLNDPALRAAETGSDRSADAGASVVRWIDWQPLAGLREVFLQICECHSALRGGYEIRRLVLDYAAHAGST